MTTTQFFTSEWEWRPWVILICAGMIFGWWRWQGRAVNRKFGWLLAGVILFYLTLASPVDRLADGYLFSAHMLQHLLLLLVVPALLWLSLSSVPDSARVSNGPWQRMGRTLLHPAIAWPLGVGGMWLWHAPALCNAAVTNEWVHCLQYVSLLLMGLAFWAPIIGPWMRQRLSPPAGMAYLFSACLGCTVLGITIAFAPVEVCSVYLHPIDRLGILPLLQNQWGLAPARDQQVGGLLMWVPACLIYSCGILGLLARWYGATSEEGLIARKKSEDDPHQKPYAS